MIRSVYHVLGIIYGIKYFCITCTFITMVLKLEGDLKFTFVDYYVFISDHSLFI